MTRQREQQQQLYIQVTTIQNKSSHFPVENFSQCEPIFLTQTNKHINGESAVFRLDLCKRKFRLKSVKFPEKY